MNRTIKSIITLIVSINVVMLFAQDIVRNRTSYTPSSLSYQGYLTNNEGVPINETNAIAFNIYDSQTGGNQIWGSGYLSVNVVDGYFSVVFGDMDSVFSGTQDALFLEIIVQAELLSPRQEITAVPTAISSSNWNGGIVENPVQINSYLNVSGDGYFTGNIEANGGFFQGEVEARREITINDADLFGMYVQIDEWAYEPRILMNTDNDYGIIELRDSNNQPKIELNASNGIITCVELVQTGGLRILNSNGDVTFEIDSETGDIYYSGKLIQK